MLKVFFSVLQSIVEFCNSNFAKNFELEITLIYFFEL